MTEAGRAAGHGDQPDRAHADRLEGVPFRPVFIMGNARAGTTILYQVLSLTGCFNYVSAYDLIRYDEIVDNHLRGATAQAKRELAALFERLGVSQARFDGVGVHPDFPEEYGFHLGRLRFQLTRRSLPRFVELCRKVQLVAGNDKPILLKNPWDYRRFLFIKEALPESKFVFIHRDPVDVTGSLLRSMRTLLQERNAYHALVAGFYGRMMESGWQRYLMRRVFSSALGAKIVARQFAVTARNFVENVSALPSSDFVSLRYEDFCDRPRAVVGEVLDFLGLSEEVPVDYERLVRKPHATIRDDATTATWRELRRLNLDPYAARCGYEWR
jgi:LPS sulfotransferase NodH